MLNTGAPQGCGLSPQLYSLFTSDCSVTAHKFADDTTLSGFIFDNDGKFYREDIRLLVDWCSRNHLEINVKKTKGTIVDFRKSQTVPLEPIVINGDTVGIVQNFRFLGAEITDQLNWNIHIEQNLKKAQQRLYF